MSGWSAPALASGCLRHGNRTWTLASGTEQVARGRDGEQQKRRDVAHRHERERQDRERATDQHPGRPRRSVPVAQRAAPPDQDGDERQREHPEPGGERRRGDRRLPFADRHGADPHHRIGQEADHPQPEGRQQAGQPRQRQHRGERERAATILGRAPQPPAQHARARSPPSATRRRAPRRRARWPTRRTATESASGAREPATS